VLLLFAAVPAHRDPAAEDEVARNVEKHHEQEPPHLVPELEAGLVLDVVPGEVERPGERQQQDRRDTLEQDEEEHGGHPTAGVPE
jgi:hypothetical protein